MHNIQILEAEWKKYNKKKYRPYYLLALLVMVVLAGSIYYVKNIKLDNVLVASEKKNADMQLNVLSQKKNVDAKLLVNGPIISLQKPKEIKMEKIKPLMDMRKMNGENNEFVIPTLPVVDDIPIMDTPQIKSNTVPTTYTQKKMIKKENMKPHKRKHLNIIESSGVGAYKEVETRFNQFHDADDALFLARMYYKKGDYKKAEQWALKTNKVNKNIEEGWIIFAKSKVKTGKVSDAIHILQNYIRQSDSQEAKQLLFKIQK